MIFSTFKLINFNETHNLNINCYKVDRSTVRIFYKNISDINSWAILMKYSLKENKLSEFWRKIRLYKTVRPNTDVIWSLYVEESVKARFGV